MFTESGTRRVVIYARVSTREQAREGVSLETQVKRCETWCELHDAIHVETIIDAGVSGKSLRRDGMHKLRRLVAAGRVDTVVVTELDRLTRSARDCANVIHELTGEGVSIVAIDNALDTSTATGRLVTGIMSYVAEFQREQTAKKTRDTMQHRKAQGRNVGRPPVGFTSRNGKLVPVSRERLALARYAAVHHARGRSLREIAERFNRDDVPTGSGSGRWHAPAIRRLINSWRLYERQQEAKERNAQNDSQRVLSGSAPATPPTLHR